MHPDTGYTLGRQFFQQAVGKRIRLGVDQRITEDAKIRIDKSQRSLGPRNGYRGRRLADVLP